MSTTFPEALYAMRLRPLADRLDAEAVLTSAVAIAETPAVLADPRMEGALLAAIYAAPGPRCLVAWPDGSFGFAFLPAGQGIGASLAAAYDTARAALEALHLQDAAPAGAITH